MRMNRPPIFRHPLNPNPVASIYGLVWIQRVVLWTESDWNSKVRPELWSGLAGIAALELILHHKLGRASKSSDCTLIQSFLFLFFNNYCYICLFFIRRSGNTHTYEGHALMSKWFLAAESSQQPSRSGINISGRVTLHSNMQFSFCLLHKDVKAFVWVEVKQLCEKMSICLTAAQGSRTLTMSESPSNQKTHHIIFSHLFCLESGVYSLLSQLNNNYKHSVFKFRPSRWRTIVWCASILWTIRWTAHRTFSSSRQSLRKARYRSTLPS